ncbi:MAG TPA: ankyrin repeat domain-containing protein [Gemmataceae bacterium]|nr:ankyrin repeat domain-containing protein [Gemmataceae bacterium]
MTQPEEMKTTAYVYGVEKLNGHDAWALFKACAAGDMAKVKALLAKDRRLVNAQFWYQFPIHMAVRAGHAEIVQVLLDRGADPGQSRFTYNSWDKLLLCANERGHRQIESILRRAMIRRFNYAPDFEGLKAAIIGRDGRKIDAVLRRQPSLVQSSDALGNNALHWSVMTRQLGLIERFAALGTPIDAERADGQTPVLLAVNGATDYWYRATRGRSHPSLRNTSVLVGSLLARGAEYTISVAAAVGDQERVEQLLKKDGGLAGRLDSARVSPLSYAAREGHLHIVRLLLEHGAEPNTPEEGASEGRALFEACCGNHLQVAQLLLEHGANPNASVDSSGCCLTIGEVYHGAQAKPLQQLLRSHGAYTPPYRMSVAEMKQAIRAGHEVIHHAEFLGNLIGKCNAELLELYLDADSTVPKRLHGWNGVIYPRSPALVRRLLARGLDPNRPDWLGKTGLHACAENGDRAVAAVFLDAGADINARGLEFNETPLAAAVRGARRGKKEDPSQKAQRRRRMVEFLLKRGAATHLPGDEPWATPLAWARKLNLPDIEALLIKHGAT